MSATVQDFKTLQSSKRTITGQVKVPALGDKEVYLCKPTAGDRGMIQRALLRDEETQFYNSRLVISVACDEQGNKLFDKKDEAWLAELDYEDLEPIIDAANKLRKTDPAKNSGTT